MWEAAGREIVSVLPSVAGPEVWKLMIGAICPREVGTIWEWDGDRAGFFVGSSRLTTKNHLCS